MIKLTSAIKKTFLQESGMPVNKLAFQIHKGDRVAAYYTAEEADVAGWYVGTASTCNGTTIRIKFDDDSIDKFDTKAGRVYRIGSATKHTEDRITPTKLKLYIKALDKEDEEEDIKPAKKVATPKVAVKKAATGGKTEAWLKTAFENATIPDARHTWLKQAWEHLNVTRFDGALSAPSFELIKQRAAESGGLTFGWRPSARRLRFTPRMFNTGFTGAMWIVLRSMTYQAGSELPRDAKGNYMDKDGWYRKTHNPKWEQPTGDDFKNSEEQKKSRAKKAVLDTKKDETKNLMPMSAYRCFPGAAVQTLLNVRGKDPEWVVGFVADKTSSNAIAFVPCYPSSFRVPSGTYYSIKVSALYEPSPEMRKISDAQAGAMQYALNEAAATVRRKANRRDTRSAMKKAYWGLF